MSAMKNLSLFVPFVFPNFDQKYVNKAFAKIGDVDRVDFVAKQDRNGNPYNAVYVHFKELYRNELATHIWEQCFQKNGQTQFYHDDTTYFWIVLPNTAKKHVPGERKHRIGLGDSNVINVKSIEKTPEKQLNEESCPGAPKKKNYAEIVSDKPVPTKLDFEFEEHIKREAELAEIEAEMEAEDKKLEAEDKNLICIDGRYVRTIEEENQLLRREILQLKMELINYKYTTYR
jgi:glutamate/tyrosine decarboxylase-like PLP-dependent enzyme